jgi:hypothetical protein
MPILFEPKTPGVSYVVHANGLELPVLDLVHPAFAVDGSPEHINALVAESRRDMGNMRGLRGWLTRRFLGFLLRRSIIGRGMLKAQGGFLDGTSTYLFKLGTHLGPWATPIDRRLCSSLAGVSLRLRTQFAAELAAAGLRPALEARPDAELHVLDLAGGPCAASLNALRLLQHHGLELLRGRALRLHVLDLDQAGPDFAEASLKAWLAPGGPLAGLDAQLLRHRYDWHEPSTLRSLLQSLPKDAVVALISEGGLFDYGSDTLIETHLRLLREAGPADLALVGSYSASDSRAAHLRQFSRNSVIQRNRDEAGGVLERGGWERVQQKDTPMGSVFLARSLRV